MILYGRRTVLFPIEVADIERFVALHRGDRTGYMLRMSLSQMSEEEARRYVTLLLVSRELSGWTVYAKQGRKSDCIGFAYLQDVTPRVATLSGIMDPRAVKSLGRHVREGRYTYAEDVSRVVIDYCFTKLTPQPFDRLETMVRADNRRAVLLNQKVGWQQEGVLREAYADIRGTQDVYLMGLLRKEWGG
jgi:RimJ/RimL family protein N-acetyltransferase